MELSDQQEKYAFSLEQLRQKNADMVSAQVTLEREARERTAEERADREELRHSVELWQKKLRELETNERQLKARLSDVQQRQEHLDRLTEEMRTAEREQTTRLDAERSEYRDRFEQQLAKVEHRAEQLDRRDVTLRQLHGDVSRMYRDALDLRLSTENVWAEVCEDVSPAEATERLAEFRGQLNDQYQLAEQTLEDKRQEIDTLVQRLAQHESRLAGQRNELRAWASRRQSEIESQAAKLLDRERDLDRQDANHRQSEQTWMQTKDGLEQEIRRLRRLVSPSSA